LYYFQTHPDSSIFGFRRSARNRCRPPAPSQVVSAVVSNYTILTFFTFTFTFIVVVANPNFE
jgi:hypothetical protein